MPVRRWEWSGAAGRGVWVGEASWLLPVVNSPQFSFLVFGDPSPTFQTLPHTGYGTADPTYLGDV